MQPEDIGPILAMAEHRERKEWHRKQREAFRADWNSSNPSDRCRRARHFASQVMAMLHKFVPEACVDEAFEELMVTAYGHDVEIVQVPLERDAQNAARMEEAMMQVAAPIIIPKN